ncbi:DUF3536 domain-containing protein [Deltaproteobacteria bacterium]|nr:DUF3536 domain-containing protein [Deltaproteobacteria bacterium]
MVSQNPESNKYLCIHGHFYQPPRENPWLDIVEHQKSAFPYHDWNERITRECYGPNTRSRLHGEESRIIRLVNNYEYMSFNFGPTLLTWLEQSHPWIYDQILAADRSSLARYKGHGNALAQVYNHIIMPLASSRDKLTQIRWGIADFRHRFGRDPEGMWLAETAVDNETLCLMAKEGLKFTILSPTQAHAIQPLANSGNISGGPHDPDSSHDSTSWQDVSGGSIDPTRPYRVLLDKEASLFIDVFFYDGPLSRAIAYEKLLTSGKNLLERIDSIFKGHNDGPRLVNIATDGESYGHHFKFGEMALAWLFDHVEQNQEIRLTNYGLFLELFPPENEVKLFENSSWSCSHGIDRWRADCGCSVSQNPSWNQAWRTPLRDGIDWLGAELSSVFEKRAPGLLKDPWGARDDYIRSILNQSGEERKDFLDFHSIGPLNEDEKIEILKLMESQRMALFMFTSCGWFFDDISGIEAAQVLMYASRAIDLVRPWAAKDLEKGLMEFLVRALSNDPDYGNGENVYKMLVKPSRIDPTLLTAHYALASLVKGPLNRNWLSKIVTVMWQREIKSNGLAAWIGEIKIHEDRTGEGHAHIYFAIRRDGKDFSCLVGNRGNLDPAQLIMEIQSALSQSSDERLAEIFAQFVPEAQRFILGDLIPDTRKWIIDGLAGDLGRSLKDTISKHDILFKEFINILQEAGEPVPALLNNLFRLVFADRLFILLASDQGKHEVVFDDLIGLASLFKPATGTLEYIIKEPPLKQKAQDFLRQQVESATQSNKTVFLKSTINFLDFVRKLNMEPDLWECQNLFYDIYKNPESMALLNPGISLLFKELGIALGFLIKE